MEKKRKILKRLIPYILVGALVILGYEAYSNRQPESSSEVPVTTELRGDGQRETPITDKQKELPKKTLLEVPFTPQAPFGNWDDERQQDGCEEASLLMAARWANGQSLSFEEAEQEIFELAAFQEKRFGTFHDTSAADTKILAEEYLKLSQVELKYDISIEDIKKELAAGKLVLAPANGQALKNKYFQQPGPERHFLVIRGYDEKNFITNDPGTKRGEEFKYPYSTLLNAIRDYPTGDKEPITNERRAILIISKEI